MIMDFKQLKHWLYLLAATFINGFASGAVLLIADPATFNLKAGIAKTFETAALFGLFQAFLFLKKSPLPSITDAEISSVEGKQ